MCGVTCFCCCCELKGAVKVAIFLSLFGFFYSVFGLATVLLGLPWFFSSHRNPPLELNSTILLVFEVIFTILMVLCFFSFIVICIGFTKERPGYILIWLIISAVGILITIAKIIIMTLMYLVVTMLYYPAIIFVIYVWIGVLKYLLSEEGGQRVKM